MLGPAEIREFDEALNEERVERPRSVKTNPYLPTPFSMGLAMTRAATAGLKHSPLGFPKR